MLEVMSANNMLPDMPIANSISRALSFCLTEDESDTSGMQQSLPAISGKEVYEAAVANNPHKLLRSKQPPPRRRKSVRRSVTIPPALIQQHYGDSQTSNGVSNTSFRVGNEGANIRWETLSKGSTPVCASSSLFTQILFSERSLDFKYPDLVVDLTHEFGTKCKCGHTLSLNELNDNWDPDPNKYTVKCPFCQWEFVPRFSVFTSDPNWMGSEGRGTPLWCEMLSPWVLQKELLTVMSTEGIEFLVSSEFRDASTPLHMQNAVLFWNMIVSFRTHGLPYGFLISDKISMALLVPLDQVS
jgi:hypothetical protein